MSMPDAVTTIAIAMLVSSAIFGGTVIYGCRVIAKAITAKGAGGT